MIFTTPGYEKPDQKKVKGTFNPFLGGDDGVIGTKDDPNISNPGSGDKKIINPILGGDDNTVFTPDDPNLPAPNLPDPETGQKLQDNMIPEVSLPSLPKVKTPDLGNIKTPDLGNNPLGNQFDNQPGGGFIDKYQNTVRDRIKAIKDRLNSLKMPKIKLPKLGSLNPLDGLGSTVVKLGTVAVGGYVVVKILGSKKKKGRK